MELSEQVYQTMKGAEANLYTFREQPVAEGTDLLPHPLYFN